MAEKGDKKGDKEKTIIEYFTKNDGDKAQFEDFWRTIRTSEFDLDEQDDNQKTALIHAAESNNTEKAWVLLEFFADPNKKDKDGRTALHIATQDNKKEFTFLLLLFGANPEEEDNEGKKPFDGKEDELENLKRLIEELKDTFIFMTRKRRKLLRHCFRHMENLVTGNNIEPTCMAKYYFDIYGIDENEGIKDATDFRDECVKHKLDTNDKETLTFEDFFIGMLKIAHVKGMETLDVFLNDYKKFRTEVKRKYKEEEAAKKAKEQQN